MSKIKVYLCGPINGLSDYECNWWRNNATHVLEAYGNVEVLNPMIRDARGLVVTPESVVLPDITDIADCDIILVRADEPQSSRQAWGTPMELVYALQYQKPVVAWGAKQPYSPWLEYHSTTIAPTLESALERVTQLVPLLLKEKEESEKADALAKTQSIVASVPEFISAKPE